MLTREAYLLLAHNSIPNLDEFELLVTEYKFVVVCSTEFD